MYECYECGNLYPADELNDVNGNDICDDCLNDDYITCDCCGDYVHTYDAINDDDMTLCQFCYENYYYRCEGCNCIVHRDDVYYTDVYYYCQSCYDEKEDIIYNYNYTPYLEFYGDGNGFYGVEVEIDDGNNRNSTARELYDIAGRDHIYCKYDGSLTRGFEIVSHPMTLNYHMQNMPWEDVFNECMENGFKSHDTTTCGLHIHASRVLFGGNSTEIDLTAAKIMLLFTKFWDSHIVNFTRRSTSALRDWARRPDEIIDAENDDEPTILNKVDYEKRGSRYKALNLTNRNTIEFRLFRGTLKYTTFIACLQFVDYLIHFAKKTSLKKLNDFSWQDIFKDSKYKELNNYLKKRGLM